MGRPLPRFTRLHLCRKHHGRGVENAGKASRLWAEDEPELPIASKLDSLRKRRDVREDLAAGGMAVYVPLIVAE